MCVIAVLLGLHFLFSLTNGQKSTQVCGYAVLFIFSASSGFFASLSPAFISLLHHASSSRTKALTGFYINGIKETENQLFALHLLFAELEVYCHDGEQKKRHGSDLDGFYRAHVDFQRISTSRTRVQEKNIK